MDSFSVVSLCSRCSAISHSAIATAAEIADLLATSDASANASANSNANDSRGVSQQSEQLASLAEVLQEFSVSVNQFETSINGASVLSPRLQEQLGDSLDACQARLAPLGKQVMRLQPSTVSRLNGMFVMVYGDLLVANTQLLGFFNEVLSLPERDDQDAVLNSTEGRRIIDQTGEAIEMLSKAGDIMVETPAVVPARKPVAGDSAKDEADEPPPYQFEDSVLSSAAGPSSAAAAQEQGQTWGSSLKQTFKALTSGLRAKPDPLVTTLCEASRRGDVSQIAALIKQEVNIDGRDENGETALMVAITGNQAAAARFLLASGADDKQWSKMPPLFLAASLGSLEVAQMIYDRGGSSANVKKESMSGQPYFVDVVSSDNLDGVRFLLEKGANAKASSVAGRPVVVQAARKGSVEMVKLLLDFGAKVNSDDLTGNSMLSIALDKSNYELMELLISRGVKLGSSNTTGEKVLSSAISKRNLRFAKRLLEAGANANIDDLLGQKVIVNAVKDPKIADDEKVELIELLLQNGAKATSKEVFWPNMHLLPCAIDKGVDARIITLLLKHGASSSKMLHSGETPLTHAITNNRKDYIDVLLGSGVDINQQNKSEKTPLMRAVVRQDLDLVKLLVQHGADVDAPGSSAREFAETLGRQDMLDALGIPAPESNDVPEGDEPPGYDEAMGKS